jgi:hypothetical protein
VLSLVLGSVQKCRGRGWILTGSPVLGKGGRVSARLLDTTDDTPRLVDGLEVGGMWDKQSRHSRGQERRIRQTLHPSPASH